MKLRLVKQEDFLGTKCDFYVDDRYDIYMSRTQVGYALQYKSPSDAIRNIHMRHYKRLDDMSIEVTTAQIERVSKHQSADKITFMYTVSGVFEICRHSNQPVADAFFDWVYKTSISIMKNGYYIASEKDAKWLGLRQEVKKVRKLETDQIKRFVEYAKAQGSGHAEKYYMNFTQLVQKKLSLESGGRDNADQKMLLRLKSFETLIDMHLETLMREGLGYKEVYQGVKNLIEAI